MSLLGRLKQGSFSLIASNRESPLVRAAEQVARFVEDAYHNNGSDFSRNGERHVLDRLATCSLKTVFDVGANEGHWSKYVLDQWSTARVHAFEIAPSTAQIATATLRDAIAANRATLNVVGLSDADAEIEMFYFPDNNQLTCDEPRHEAHASTRFIGRVTTLDAYCRAHSVAGIDFLKIDVEGHEHKVLAGAQGLIGAGQVACIQFEYGAFATSTRFLLKDFYALLAPRYLVGKIFPRGVLFRDYDWTMEDFRFGNFICVRRDCERIVKAVAYR